MFVIKKYIYLCEWIGKLREICIFLDFTPNKSPYCHKYTCYRIMDKIFVVKLNFRSNGTTLSTLHRIIPELLSSDGDSEI